MHLSRSKSRVPRAVAAVALCGAGAPAALGVITYNTPNDAVYAVAPTGPLLVNSGWQWEGAWQANDFTATGTAIGPQYMITAGHVGGAVGRTFTLNGVNYTATRFANGDNQEIVPNTDLWVWRVVATSTISSYAPLYDSSVDGSEANKSMVLFGRGTERGAAYNYLGTQRGWLWGADTQVQRWGQNTVVGFANYATNGDQKLIGFYFDAGATNEATLSNHDSGGGDFIKVGSVWKLAGVNYGVQATYDTAPGTTAGSFDAALYDETGLYYAGTTMAGRVGGGQLGVSSRVGLAAATIKGYINHWTADANGTWTTSSNWFSGTPGASDAANFTYAATGPRTITVPGALTIGTIGFDNTNPYTIAGPGTITLAGTNTNGLSALNGQHVIGAPISFGRHVPVYVESPSASITLTTAPITNGLGLSMSGAGTLILPNFRGGFIIINSGTVKVAPNGTAGGTSRITSLTTTAGTFDLTNNDMVIDYSGSSPADAVRQQLLSARNGGAWNGAVGITSSAAAGDADKVTAIGYAEASALLGPAGGSFSGQNADGTSLLLKYTYYGDANLDGAVTLDDYALLDRGAAQGLSGWVNGDFNYDGVVDAGDYALADRAYGLQSGVLSPALLAERDAQFGDAYVSALVASVPEPGAVAAFSLAVPLIVRRRTRAGRPCYEGRRW